MRIERVIARAFGPFHGETLELAPGMTVVVGPNEAGKSTWHAAMRLAITGIRRARGRATAADAAMEARHRPWDQPDQWEVEARLALDDGRSIDISQDLAGKVACRAWDVALGRDVSDEIVDGTPDASRWLGLDRDAFAATVSVSQAQILAVAEAADQLQEHMQRAAATRGTEATAAEAIARLEEFRRQAVGADTVAARGPLRAAKSSLGAAEARLAEARRLHDAYLSQGEAVEAAERAAAAARTRLAIAEAAIARRLADEAARRLGRATELAARHPAAPPTLAARDEAANAVAAAVEAWTTRPPEQADVDGPSANELREELAALPPTPEGDEAPHPTVVAAVRALDLADEALRTMGDPPSTAEPAAGAIDERGLRELARRLRGHAMPRAASLEAEVDAAHRDLESAPRRQIPAALAAALAIVGLLGLLLSAPLLGAGLLALAVGAAGWAWLAFARRRSAVARIERARAALAPYQEAAELAAAERDQAIVEAQRAALPTDPAALEALADEVGAAFRDRRQAEAWNARRGSLEERRAAAADALRRALEGRGAVGEGDLPVAWSTYQEACAARAQQAAQAGRREALVRELAVRAAAERSAAAASQVSEAAERRLRDAAAAVGGDPALAPAELVVALIAWQGERAAAGNASQVAIAEWERLQSLLGGRTLEELRAETDERARRADALAAELGDASIEPWTDEVELDAAGLRDEVSRLEREAGSLTGSLSTRGEGLPDVVEAEEQADAARRELQRVESLARILDETLRLLRAAEERIHRSLAPILADAVGRWLPVICDGAYAEVSVDPADLSVMVKEVSSGQWRQAKLLSEGTREQIYLLLRVAMAQHLVTTGETAPLLLDEVTAQADVDRKRQLLAVLHHLSRERQVVLFSHDDDVADWADRALEAPRDAIVRLRRPGASGIVPVLDQVAVGS
jgi:ABC-type cobalamin transport system ATPase subunit